jgi:hypothetical protein
MREWTSKLLRKLALPIDDITEYLTLRDHNADDLSDFGIALSSLVMASIR